MITTYNFVFRLFNTSYASHTVLSTATSITQNTRIYSSLYNFTILLYEKVLMRCYVDSHHVSEDCSDGKLMVNAKNC